MEEVLDNNFDEIYPDIESTIKNATFISIDAEFTGIQSNDQIKYSLFDTIDDRYKLLKKNIDPFIIIQCGVAAFQHFPQQNTYRTKCYNFYLLPRPLPFKNRTFLLQVAALEFLSIHNFDFNKSMHNGISYVDQIDEQLLREYVEEGKFMSNLEHLSYHEEDVFKECKDKVEEWLVTPTNEITYELATVTPILQYMVHKELRTHFKNIWTISGNKSVIVIRVSEDMRRVYEEKRNVDLDKALLDTYIGFSKIFKLLTSSKKPIIGHNILLDLMLMHQQFYKPLPKYYSEFKTNIHSLFPQLYDTKFLSSEFKKRISGDVNWKISSLRAIYEYLKLNKGKSLALNSPHIKMHNISEDKEAYHTAGWDAYLAGYIFIKMGYLLTIQKYGEGLALRPVTHTEIMSSVKQFANLINLTRGNELYLKLDGHDPVYTRPEFLHVKLNTSPTSMKEIAEKFSPFGPIDVMPFARKRVLVAVSNEKSVLNILAHFQNNQEMQVAVYNPIKHAHPRKIVLWSSLILSSGVLAWMIQRVFKKSVTFD
nr:pre-piRNA 3'-exonuclease trimmer-like isoform X1 [Megalopta genalis]